MRCHWVFDSAAHQIIIEPAGNDTVYNAHRMMSWSSPVRLHGGIHLPHSMRRRSHLVLLREFIEHSVNLLEAVINWTDKREIDTACVFLTAKTFTTCTIVNYSINQSSSGTVPASLHKVMYLRLPGFLTVSSEVRSTSSHDRRFEGIPFTSSAPLLQGGRRRPTGLLAISLFRGLLVISL
jgi:hypothetical protein